MVQYTIELCSLDQKAAAEALQVPEEALAPSATEETVAAAVEGLGDPWQFVPRAVAWVKGQLAAAVVDTGRGALGCLVPSEVSSGGDSAQVGKAAAVGAGGVDEGGAVGSAGAGREEQQGLIRGQQQQQQAALPPAQGAAVGNASAGAGEEQQKGAGEWETLVVSVKGSEQQQQDEQKRSSEETGSAGRQRASSGGDGEKLLLEQNPPDANGVVMPAAGDGSALNGAAAAGLLPAAAAPTAEAEGGLAAAGGVPADGVGTAAHAVSNQLGPGLQNLGPGLAAAAGGTPAGAGGGPVMAYTPGYGPQLMPSTAPPMLKAAAAVGGYNDMPPPPPAGPAGAGGLMGHPGMYHPQAASVHDPHHHNKQLLKQDAERRKQKAAADRQRHLLENRLEVHPYLHLLLQQPLPKHIANPDLEWSQRQQDWLGDDAPDEEGGPSQAGAGRGSAIGSVVKQEGGGDGVHGGLAAAVAGGILGPGASHSPVKGYGRGGGRWGKGRLGRPSAKGRGSKAKGGPGRPSVGASKAQEPDEGPLGPVAAEVAAAVAAGK